MTRQEEMPGSKLGSGMTTLNWASFFRPALEAPIHVGHVGVANLLQGIRSQRGAPPGHAVHDDATFGVKLRSMQAAGRICPEFEHAPRCVYRTGDVAVLGPFLALAQIDQERALAQLGSNLSRGKALDAGARIGNQLGSCFRFLIFAHGFLH